MLFTKDTEQSYLKISLAETLKTDDVDMLGDPVEWALYVCRIIVLRKLVFALRHSHKQVND